MSHGKNASLNLTAAQVAQFERLSRRSPAGLQRRAARRSPSVRRSVASVRAWAAMVIDLSEDKPGDWAKLMREREVVTPPWVRDALESRED